MKLVLNYFVTPTRPTGFNLAFVRVFFCVYSAWKIATYPFYGLAKWPEFFYKPHDNAFFVLWPGFTQLVVLEQALCVVGLLLCAAGWRRVWTCPITALLIAHLSGLNFCIINEKMFLPAVYFLLLYSTFRNHDVLTLDNFREATKRPATELNQKLKTPRTPGLKTQADYLKWYLLLISLIYFFCGWGKVDGNGWLIGWARADNARLMLEYNALYHIGHVPWAMEQILRYDGLLVLGTAGTLILEMGFVVAVLLKRSILPFVVGLALMHICIFFTMKVNYFTDMFAGYLCFVAWDSFIARGSAGRRLRVVYDDNCSFCVRTLLGFKHIDAHGGLQFLSPSDLPAHPDLPAKADYDQAMYVFDESGRTHRGYFGFCALINYFVPLRPVNWLMHFAPVAWVGQKAYALIARNRSRFSTCALPT